MVGNVFALLLYMCAPNYVCMRIRLYVPVHVWVYSPFVIISYAWRPNSHWHFEWWAKELSVQLLDSTVDGTAQQKRRESILYIFSAIEQSPRSVDRQTPQRDWERQRWREREEERERVSVRLQGSMLRFMVLWCILCVCMGSVVRSLAWPWPGAPLSKVFEVELTRWGWGGHSQWGHNSLCPPR